MPLTRPYAEGFWSEVLADKDGRIVGLEKATLKTLSEDDAKILLNDIIRVANPHKEPMISEMILNRSGYIRALTEAINDYSKQGYGGMAADGHELTAQWFTPQDFHVSGDETKPHYSGWQRWISAPGTDRTFIGGTTVEEEGLIILGFVNHASCPKVDAVKVYKGTEQSVVEPLNWLTHTVCCKGWDPVKAEKASGVGFDGCTGWEQNCFYGGGSMELPVAELRMPILIPPETEWRIDEINKMSGCDALQPIGFRIRTAAAAWNLTF